MMEKLLGHIISEDGVKVDPERIDTIKKVAIPKNVKSVPSFNGQINFIRRFIPNLAELMKPMQKFLKKDAKFEWTNEGREAFKNLKEAISKYPISVNPDYSKDFQIFYFALEDNIVGVLLQNNNEGFEQPIAFMSRALKESELKYTTMEKQAYALVKSLKHFRTYVGYSKIIAYVPHSAVKDILS